MTSSGDDMNPTGSGDGGIGSATPGFDAPALLAAVEEAAARLASSERIPDEVAGLVRNLEDVLGAHDPGRTLGGVDPWLAEGLLGGAVVCLGALCDEDPRSGRRRLRLGLEQVRQSLRDIVEGAPAADDRPLGEVIRWLADVLAVPQGELADLFGVRTRTVQRWLAGEATPRGDDEVAVRTVARVAAHLRHAMTGPGVVRWLVRPHPRLGGRTPRDLLRTPAGVPRIVELAARDRSMVAT